MLILLRLLPFKMFIGIIKKDYKISSEISEKEAYRLVTLTLRRLKKITPYNLSCLIKSIVFKKLFGVLGYNCRLVFSVKNDTDLKAHAYIKINEEKYFLRNALYNDIYEYA